MSSSEALYGITTDGSALAQYIERATVQKVVIDETGLYTPITASAMRAGCSFNAMIRANSTETTRRPIEAGSVAALAPSDDLLKRPRGSKSRFRDEQERHFWIINRMIAGYPERSNEECRSSARWRSGGYWKPWPVRVRTACRFEMV